MTLVVVAGSRSIIYKKTVFRILDEFHKKTPVSGLVSGGAKGADTLGLEWARLNQIPYKVFLPDWNGLGKKAGIVRNIQMADYIKENQGEAIIFWDGSSPGTKNMVEECEKRDIQTYIHTIKRVEILTLPILYELRKKAITSAVLSGPIVLKLINQLISTKQELETVTKDTKYMYFVLKDLQNGFDDTSQEFINKALNSATAKFLASLNE